MKALKAILILGLFMILHPSDALSQVKNPKTVTVKVSGNCSMCKKKIEKAGNKKNVSTVVWNADTKTAVVTWDTTKTTLDKLLKDIASAGYDNEKFTAPDEAYEKLEPCCQYERK